MPLHTLPGRQAGPLCPAGLPPRPKGTRQINAQLQLKLLEERQVELELRQKQLAQQGEAFFSTPFKAEFEQRFVFGRETQESSRGRVRTQRYAHWCAAQRVILKTRIDPSEWVEQVHCIYDYFSEMRLSMSYTQKILRMMNLWGYFICRKIGKPFMQLPYPRGFEKRRLQEAYFEKATRFAISTTSANLLYAAILSNTLNHTAAIATPRDRAAAIDLKRRTSLSEDWHMSYFSDVETAVLKDVGSAINRDKKQVEIDGNLYWIAQIEMWHGSLVLENEVIEQMIAAVPAAKRVPRSFVNVVDIENGRNIIVSRNPGLLRALQSRYHGRFIRKNILEIGRPILRKEILKDLMQDALNIN